MLPRYPLHRLKLCLQSFRRLLLVGLFGLSLIVNLLTHHLPAYGRDVINPTVHSVEQLVQQGIEYYQQGDLQRAITHWQMAMGYYQQQASPADEAIVLENLARAHQVLGQNIEAITLWQQVIDRYQVLQAIPSHTSHDYLKQLGRSLTEQAQVYNRVGQLRYAITLLCGSLEGKEHCTSNSALAIAQVTQDMLGETAALGSLGQVHRLMGDYPLSMTYLNEALAKAQQLGDPVLEAATYADLGATVSSQATTRYRQANSAEFLGDTTRVETLRQQGQTLDRAASQYFADSLQRPIPTLNRLRVLLAGIPVYDRVHEMRAAQQARQQALELLNSLPASQEKALAAIDLAQLLVPVTVQQPQPGNQCLLTEAIAPAETLLRQALETSQQIGDQRSQSFALGKLGQLYECQQAYAKAFDLTQQARIAAERDLDSRYLWEWQAGRILQQQGQPVAAIEAYEQAIATLEAIRNDILVANRDVQFDFRDTIEPIYRQLVSLRLKQGNPSELLPVSTDQTKDDLSQVLTTLDSLKLAELQNYFGNDCVLTARNLDLAAPNDLLTQGDRVALFSTVVLDEETAIILTLPDGRRKYEWIPLTRSRLTEIVNQYRRELEIDFRRYDPQQAQYLYDLLIHPFDDILAEVNVETLVFVQDGILRSVPMSSLYDGTQFLIQKFAVAYTPSLELTSLNPLHSNNLRALVAGLTTESPATSDAGFFTALTNVETEIRTIITQLPKSVALIGPEFTLKGLESTLDADDFPILHIATHGVFGTEAGDTFLVTGEIPNNKLTLNNLDYLLRQVKAEQPVELLVLTACTTAVGDDRAALGLAGVAAQAGVRSVLASLWFVNDAATASLVETFYDRLNSLQISKAKALQQAQIKLIETEGEFARPAYWAPFILVGSWL